ncbi:probable E3 ubiquitin-protein ligase ARI8 [Impatiens glandulifera]|uniref:probable E3 ubiquitin-protein ligase ARI8 n=1 Tax=Impatiens glandulifera TaxID=253017 RepID=UPI001FB16F50|nr:probable E3 ubiquitin-protein ligase ARI8 [Impatiens glandulifera]XP_047321619.1 probable E3 ubiquitin-protein ligase ARI8 [Impatiens glandulifera]
MDSNDDTHHHDQSLDSFGGDSAEQNNFDHLYDDLIDKYMTLSLRQEEKNYNVIEEADIRIRQEEDITTLATILSIPRAAASILLQYYHWSATNVHDAWFTDENSVRKAVGLLEEPIVEYPNTNKVTCDICFESYPLRQFRSTFCGHFFCRTCWKAYIKVSIGDGAGCLMLRCPYPTCIAVVDQDMINSLALKKDKKKYAQFLIRSYVEENPKIKWCPAPGCKYAVEFVIGSESYDVTCLCSHRFCWNCTEESHPSVDCSTVANWFSNVNYYFNSVNWITQNTKPCPKCKVPIEKSVGCMRIMCRPPCNFIFCWTCLGKWSDHENDHDIACNSYKRDKQRHDDTVRKQTHDKSLEMYNHYHDRWAANSMSRRKALVDLHELHTVNLQKLIVKQSQPEAHLKFIIDAWQQIVECRRILQWSYIYGFYLPYREHAKRRFFEYLQGEAESCLERLHHCAEHDIQIFLRIVCPSPPPNFNDFRAKLAGLTSITRNYFENLVKALENNLSEVNPESQGDCSKNTEDSAGDS